jgi:3-hydroxyisobutyrate dehydrogenase-like beta-hydroxyacid dehydrogenase
MSARWAILGFGEAAQVFVGSDLLGPVVPTVILPGSRPISAVTAARLQESGINPQRDPADIAAADVVISLVTPGAAVDIAQLVAQYLRPGAMYIDANSITGQAARLIEEVITAHSGSFVDVAIMGALPLLRSSVPLYASGVAAPALASLLSDLGLRPRVISDRPGDASDLKMLWGVMSKGAIGLVAETLTAAERLGLTVPIRELLNQEFGRTGSDAMLLRMLESTARAGPRRLEEMAAIRDTLAFAGVPAFMVDGATAWIRLLSHGGAARDARDLDTAIKSALIAARAHAASRNLP